jgi:uncharacterized protein involved in exopolysaccharide biosynthesis
MEEQKNIARADREIRVDEYFAILRSVWWKIALLSLAVGVVAMLWMLRQPNLYRASSTIAPSPEENKQSPGLGALATFGVSIGGPSKVEDLESLFKSNDLTVRVFKKYDLWSIVLPKIFDPKTGKVKPGWLDRLLGKGQEGKPPGDWDAIRAAKNGLLVSTNRKSGSLILSFESPSAEGSARIVRYYLDEAKNRIQEEALDRAAKNKKFIEEQIGRTVDALTRDRLYSLYGQEVEREMLARNREQFGFRIIDSPRVPDRKSRPQRARAAVTATIVAVFAWCAFFILRGKKNGS